MPRPPLVALAASLLAALGCGSDTAEAPAAAPLPSPFAASVTGVTLEVDYARGAEPYTGTTSKGGAVWQLFASNAEKLFETRGKKLTIPASLDQMEALDDVTGEDFTAEQILAIAARHRGVASSQGEAAYYALWLGGYFRDATGVRSDVLGVSLGTTRVIAMFKPVISGAGATKGVDRFVEQGTLIHEFGHAVGLVNNGVPMVAPHQDADHGAHCSNDACVMYWANEGAADLLQFVNRYIATGDATMFGEECLADARAAR